jgi:RNA polymerase sporulation-specific sigma factor
MNTKLLTATEERELARRIRKGDKAARAQFIEANLRLAKKLARKFHAPGMDADDLEQEAMIALIRTVDAYDPDKGRFSTLAYPAITNYLATVVCRTKRRTIPTVSLSTPVNAGEDEEFLLEETIADPSQDTEAAALSSLISRALLDLLDVVLTPREVRVLELRYGLGGEVPHYQHEVAPLLKLSRSRIQQLELEALAKLRKHYESGNDAPGLRQLLIAEGMIESAA